MKEVALTKGKIALVDDEDYESLCGLPWFAQQGPITWYAARTTRESGKRKKFYMHRVILNAPKLMQVDHRDGNGLNNQKANLRLATPRQNKQNVRPNQNNKLGYRGVRQVRHGGWQSMIRNTYLGIFSDPESAARAYDTKAKELYGEFARLNFPEGEVK